MADLIELIFTDVWIYLVIITAIVGFVIIKITQGRDKRPETKAGYGHDLLSKTTNKQLKSRSETWGYKSEATLYKGMYKIGKVIKIDPKPTYNDTTPIELLSIAFRGFGFINWLKAYFGKYKYLVIDHRAVVQKQEEKKVVIQPNVHLVENAGVWVLSDKRTAGWLSELNAQYQLDNQTGFSQDYLRRLASQDPSVSSKANLLTHEADLEERKRKSRISSWVGK